MPNPPISAIGARHWMVVVGSGLLMSLNVLMFLAVGLLLPPLATSLDVGLGAAMGFASLNTISGALTLALAGTFLIRRLGIRRLIVGGGIITGTLIFAVSWVNGLLALYLLAFTAGLLPTVAFQMTGAALVSEWFIRRRGLMQGLLMGIAGVGGIVAGVVLPPVVEAGGWQLGFQVVGVVTVAVAVAAGTLLIRSRPAEVGLYAYGSHDPQEEAEDGDGSGLVASAAVRTPQFVALVAGLTCFSGIMAMQQHFPSLMADRGLDLTAAGSLLSLLSVVNVGTTLLLGGLSDRRGPLVAYLLSGVLLVAALGLMLVTVGYPAQTAAVLLYSVPAVTPPILTPILLRATVGGRAFVPLLGVATATMPAGIAIGSPLWGLSKDLTGSYATALLAAAVLAVLAVALVSYALATGPRLWRPAAQDVTV